LCGAGDVRRIDLAYVEQAPRKGPRFATPFKNRPIVYDDPELEDLEPEEAAYLRGVVGDAELALYERSGEDWREHLDEDAAVDYLLLQELFKNLDAFRSSTFLHKGAGELLTFGPVWDLDLAMANAARGSVESPRGWLTRERQWASQLHADEAFRRALARRWRELRDEDLAEEMLATVDRSARELGPAVDRNFERWPILDERAWQEPAVRGSFPAEVGALRAWLEARVAWLDAETTRILEG